MPTFVDVAAITDISPGTALQVRVRELRIGLYNVDGMLYAMDDLCSHDHAWLSDGEFNADACTIRCPKHTSTFDLSTGRPRTLPAIRPVATYEVKSESGRVFVLVDS